MRSTSFAIAVLLVSATASPVVRHAVHEKRDALPPNWSKSAKLDDRAVLPLRIALAQQNLHRGDEFLMEVSHPSSPNFGKHWTAKEVAETFAPSQESVDAVKTWLAEAGIAPERVSLSQGLNWLSFDAPVEEVERLLQTKYHVYEHESGQPHVACESYSVPETVSRHVDFITPTVHFDAKLAPPQEGNKRLKRDTPSTNVKSAVGVQVQPGKASKVGAPGSGSLPKKGADVDIEDVLSELMQCDTHITPDCLRALYLLPPSNGSHPDNSYGIVEYSPQAFVQTDLDLFFRNFTPELVGRPPVLDSIDGGVAGGKGTGFDLNGESNLDLEYAMALVYPLNVTVFQTGDPIASASFNNFLDAIDGSYCTYEGGDDKSQDSVYPDGGPGGYRGPESCGGFAASKVISTSYGYNEADLTPFYERRQCNEYMKLGLQGITMLFSSGDYGVAGNSGQCINPGNGTFNNGTSGLFNPSFPPTCPYVTAVGATQVPIGSTVFEPETACEKVIYSGGGFSNVFDMPAYQADAVASFLKNHPPPYGADRYNNSQKVRAYPDVAANGANYVVAIEGNFTLVYGTSASSPTFGSVITMVNEARLEAGKGPVGFLNPTLYQHPEVLNDITSGGNRGCGTPGFTATDGWDPVTGLGTPNFPMLKDLYMSLP